MSLEEEWINFVKSRTTGETMTGNEVVDQYLKNNDTAYTKIDPDDEDDNEYVAVNKTLEIPEASELNISTQSKIVFLKCEIPMSLFWDIPIIPYHLPQEGIVKKQLRITSHSQKDLNEIHEHLKREGYWFDQVITHVDNTDTATSSLSKSKRVVFKDVRKVTVGISKKDVIATNVKKSLAFYNCFVIIIRLKLNEIFKEFHVKLFNTGKVEMPGVQSETMLFTILDKVISILQPFVPTKKLIYNCTSDIILINSNFKCGFFIDQKKLYKILTNKYRLQALYDTSTSYPGIQCKFYYDTTISPETQTGVNNSLIVNKDLNDPNIAQVSFMIFRTGSVLIIGKCSEEIIYHIYVFLKKLLETEFCNICYKLYSNNCLIKSKKSRRRAVYITKNE